MSQMENTMYGINSRLNISKEKISELKDIIVKSTQNERWTQKK